MWGNMKFRIHAEQRVTSMCNLISFDKGKGKGRYKDKIIRDGIRYDIVPLSAGWHSTEQHSTVQNSTVQNSTVQYSTVQYNSVQFSTVQYSSVQFSTAQHSTAQHGMVHHLISSHIISCHGAAHYGIWRSCSSIDQLNGGL